MFGQDNRAVKVMITQFFEKKTKKQTQISDASTN